MAKKGMKRPDENISTESNKKQKTNTTKITVPETK